MCGICGIIAPRARIVDGPRLLRMRDSMRHRGPDDAGSYVAPGIGLGHRRLSIVDVAGGHQPMASDDARYHIVYNGEVYNHPELMRELEQQGVKYRTHCDTETVLRLFERNGAPCVDRLRGMFAFAIYDAVTHELMLARDRFGVKPLYYVHAADGTLYFASEIKALLAAGAVKPALNMSVLPDYLANHAPTGDETMFEGVRRLPPGYAMLWRDGKITMRRYWQLHFEPKRSDWRDDEAVEAYQEAFTEAVRMRLMADVPLGVFLSGGIDSAAIAATMSNIVGGGISTFSVAFAEREANELEYARMVSRRYDTEHHEIIVTPDDFFAALPSLVWHEDEPLAHPSSIALNFVSRLAAERVKVVLTGEGSDETLAGYNRYRVTIANLRASRSMKLLGGRLAQRGIARLLAMLPPHNVLRRKLSRTALALPPDLATIYFDNFAVFSRQRQESLLTTVMQEAVYGIDPYSASRAAIEESDALSTLDKLLAGDTTTYLHELLMKQDQMSMAASIESRVPFLDHPMVEMVSRMPQRMKLRGWTTKWILREAMRDLLPAEILSRKKMGFPVPVGTWLRGPYAHILDDLVLSPRAQERVMFDPAAVRQLVNEHRAGADHSERLWSLINMELWCRRFLDGETPAVTLPPLERGLPAPLAATG